MKIQLQKKLKIYQIQFNHFIEVLLQIQRELWNRNTPEQRKSFQKI